jgi:hypothetical protein
MVKSFVDFTLVENSTKSKLDVEMMSVPSGKWVDRFRLDKLSVQ